MDPKIEMKVELFTDRLTNPSIESASTKSKSIERRKRTLGQKTRR